VSTFLPASGGETAPAVIGKLITRQAFHGRAHGKHAGTPPSYIPITDPVIAPPAPFWWLQTASPGPGRGLGVSDPGGGSKTGRGGTADYRRRHVSPHPHFPSNGFSHAPHLIRREAR
jgi:hypothetical protein